MSGPFPTPDELLPHAGSAILIDSVLSDANDVITTEAKITATHPYFVEGKGVPAWVGIEIMAQTIAAHSGLVGHRSGGGPRRGMLLGTRRYASSVAWFVEDMRLVIRAERTFGGEGGMAACSCCIDCDDQTLVEAEIFLVEEEDK